MWHALERRKIHTGFWWECLNGRYHLESLVVDERIILKFILKDWRVWAG
jgi:hypothetical protein